MNCDKPALVDDEDYERVANEDWWVNHGGYVSRREHQNGQRVTILLHRFILGVTDGRKVDHKNNNKLDNQKLNLRPCTQRLNSRNRLLNANNTSGFKGVVLHKKTGKWSAKIRVNRAYVWLGLYKTPSEAGAAYDRAAERYYGDFAKTNQELRAA